MQLARHNIKPYKSNKNCIDVVDGIFGGKTEAAVRVLQRKHGLVPDEVVGPKTWDTLDKV